MHDDRILHYGQSETCSAQLAGATFVYTVETLEQMLQMLLWHPHAIVCKTYLVKTVFFALYWEK